MQDENWKTYLEDSRYEVSDLGRVRNRLTGKTRNSVPIKNGYMTLLFSSPRKLRYVHVMVLETFICPRPLGLTASHLNGDRKDNRLCNLVWETHGANIRRKKEHKTEPIGCGRWSAKITEEQAKIAKYSTMSEDKAAKMIGISRSQVNRIRSGKNWSHI